MFMQASGGDRAASPVLCDESVTTDSRGTALSSGSGNLGVLPTPAELRRQEKILPGSKSSSPPTKITQPRSVGRSCVAYLPAAAISTFIATRYLFSDGIFLVVVFEMGAL